MIEVLSPGLLSTFQDFGRPGYSHLGVSIAGAADPVSMRVANLLVGNREDAVVIECTLQGPRLVFQVDTWVAICGGDFICHVPMWQAVPVKAGFQLDIGGSRSGARCYIAVRGGFRNDRRVLGSNSVHLLSGFGSALRRGDVLEIGSEQVGEVRRGGLEKPVSGRGVLRVTLGPDAGDFSSAEMFDFLGQVWTVREDSNRQGIRLQGRSLGPGRHGVKPSEGVALGAIQVPPGGEPLILFVDSQTTGGYSVIANVIAADQMSVGQLRPRDNVGFEAVSFERAKELLSEQEAWIRRVG